MMTIGDALQLANETSRRDFMLLLRHVTGLSSAQVMINLQAPLNESDEFIRLAQRLKDGEPLQYILGEWDFFGKTVRTDSRALIPRPETELLVEEVLAFLAHSGGYTVLDLCTGSGCIAVAVASSGDFCVTASDISPDALSLAYENGEGLGINFVQSDMFSNLTGEFDIIVSNPPYITSAEMLELDRSVLDYEPHLALHGGLDGLDLYRRLIPESKKYLKPGGALLLEIGPPQVADIMTVAGFIDVRIKKDYAGFDRIVYGVKE